MTAGKTGARGWRDAGDCSSDDGAGGEDGGGGGDQIMGVTYPYRVSLFFFIFFYSKLLNTHTSRKHPHAPH